MNLFKGKKYTTTATYYFFVGVGNYLQMCHCKFHNAFIQCSFDPFKTIHFWPISEP